MQVCQTLVSTGTKAVFLNPTDALHGDIGIVGPDDLVVMFSKSGATEELLRLVPYAKVRAPVAAAHASIPPSHPSPAHTATAQERWATLACLSLSTALCWNAWSPQ